jgi:hypothetical protein
MFSAILITSYRTIIALYASGGVFNDNTFGWDCEEMGDIKIIEIKSN